MFIPQLWTWDCDYYPSLQLWTSEYVNILLFLHINNCAMLSYFLEQWVNLTHASEAWDCLNFRRCLEVPVLLRIPTQNQFQGGFRRTLFCFRLWQKPRGNPFLVNLGFPPVWGGVWEVFLWDSHLSGEVLGGFGRSFGGVGAWESHDIVTSLSKMPK